MLIKSFLLQLDYENQTVLLTRFLFNLYAFDIEKISGTRAFYIGNYLRHLRSFFTEKLTIWRDECIEKKSMFHFKSVLISIC